MANIFSRVKHAAKALAGFRTYDSLELLREIYGGRHESWAGKEVTLKTVMQVSAAFACARVISEGLAMLPFKVLKEHKNGDIKSHHKHPLYDLLMCVPNKLQSAFEFKETLALHLAFVGNAFVWIPRVSGRIDELLLLEPRWVRMKYNWPQMPTFEVRTDDNQTFKLTSDEVWHVRGPSWTSYMGLEFIQVAREALGLSMGIEESQARMQGQGVQTSGYISVDGTLQEEQQKKLRKWIDEEHSGSANAHRTMILDRAAKWVSTGMSNADAQMIDMREMQIEEVCRFMRVMPIMVGVSRKTATYASSEQMFLAHLVHTLGPWVARIESSADRRLLSTADRQRGCKCKFNEKVLHRMTSIDQMTYLKGAVLTGILTRNEARRSLDYNKLDGLDEPLTPVNEVAGPPPTVADPYEPTVPPGGEDDTPVKPPTKKPVPVAKPPAKTK